ncbi:MAG: 16S rRNA (uracil(1498)-N(3))-methyltransferase [Prevotellaceae bacterium]|jgi:16S rRNA (uracil1498-N3)-methyltransferase|nr:16S rRNA (uracil(1498)-N(3))-methyltransferase [Prevotellaceae bacterium]
MKTNRARQIDNIMKAPLFYSEAITDDVCVLSSDESRHCVRVMRLQKGERVRLFSGDGFLYLAELAEADPRVTILRILERNEVRRPLRRLYLAVAPTKNFDRYEWFVEKAVEIGVSSITTLICTRSERRSSKVERLERIIVSAMKQSGNLLKPALYGDISFDDFMARPFDGLKCVAHCEEHNKSSFSQLAISSYDILLMIGPEGDFTIDEISKAADSGFIPVSLGGSILRTETAAVYACAVVSSLSL